MSEVGYAIEWIRKRWDRHMGREGQEVQRQLFEPGPDQRATDFDLPPQHLRRVWNRLLEGPAESYDLKVVDINYKTRVIEINTWLVDRGEKRFIRSRQIAGARWEYWLE